MHLAARGIPDITVSDAAEALVLATDAPLVGIYVPDPVASLLVERYCGGEQSEFGREMLNALVTGKAFNAANEVVYLRKILRISDN